MELFVDDLVECHGDVRVRAMMVLCQLCIGMQLSGCMLVYALALAFIAIL